MRTALLALPLAHWGYPGQGRWHIYGLGLPDAVLRKVYHENAEKLFPDLAPGGSPREVR